MLLVSIKRGNKFFPLEGKNHRSVGFSTWQILTGVLKDDSFGFFTVERIQIILSTPGRSLILTGRLQSACIAVNLYALPDPKAFLKPRSQTTDIRRYRSDEALVVHGRAGRSSATRLLAV